MNQNTVKLRELVLGMREAYSRRENAMEYARRSTGSGVNSAEATLVAYDLQAGTYVASVQANPVVNARWCSQLAAVLAPHMAGAQSLLEVGCGEATTLAGVLQNLPVQPRDAYGFDISWSRCAVGLDWLKSQRAEARLFVADLFQIPLADDSIDVVYTSHSIEPNGGREEAALRELLRVARNALVLVEPLYELADEPARARMRAHGYVRDLKATAERLGASVLDYRLLEHSPNPENPSGVIVIRKVSAKVERCETTDWRCPLTGTMLEDTGDTYHSRSTGIVYPVLRGIPLLRPEHAVVATSLLKRPLTVAAIA